jgi:hypothetical protein
MFQMGEFGKVCFTIGKPIIICITNSLVALERFHYMLDSHYHKKHATRSRLINS